MALFYPRCRAQISVVFDGRGGEDVGPVLLETDPRECAVALTSYHEADTWSLTFDMRLLPLDPDLVRSAVAAIYMWGADEYQETREWAVPEHRMVVGLADEGSMTLDLERQTIRFEGRDYTGLLLDQDWDPRDRVPVGKRLDAVVQAIVDKAAPPGATLRFQVVFESLEASRAPIVGKGRRASKRKKGLPVEPGKNTWDVVYELCLSHGFIVFVRGEEIVITDPQTQTQASLSEAPVIAYGRELESLEISRRLAKQRVPRLRVVGYNPRTGKRVEVLYPRKHDSPETGLGLKKDETRFLTAPKGEYDEDTLRRYAKVRFENMARAEASYRMTTRHLRDLENVDLLRLRGGRPVIVAFDPFNAEHFRSLSPAQRVDHLRTMGYSASVSQIVASHFERLAQFRQPHYTRSAEYHYGIDDGIEISVEAVNYAYEPRELAEQEAL